MIASTKIVNIELRTVKQDHHPKKHYLTDKPENTIDVNECHSLMQTYRHDETNNDSDAGKDGK